MAASVPQAELRLVVLGPVKAGSKHEVFSLLGSDEERCSKYRGEAAGRKTVVVSSPAWFSSACSPEKRKEHISSLISLSSPGPHAFLLCVPVNQPADGEPEALDVLKKLFGPVVERNTIVLFTHVEELEEDEQLEEYLVTWRKDLLELVQRCGDRYHTLESPSGGLEEGRSMEELLEKVEQLVKENGNQHFSCPLYQEAEERLTQRQRELVRQRRKEHSDEEEEELAAFREEAERSSWDFALDVDHIFPSTPIAPSSPAPSFLRGLMESLAGWIRSLSSLVSREALLGALVGLFVGGPFGGMVGATVGSVATEVGRRREEKTK